jgi:azurin
VDIDTGTPESPAVFDTSNGAYEYTDDAAVATHVEIAGFGSDDAIALTNAGVNNYAFANDGSDVMISYNYLDEGTMNVIALTGIVENNSLVYDPASFTDAVGFDPFAV